MDNDKERRNRLDGNDTPIAILHAGMYVYANAAFLRLLGYQRFSEIEGIPALDMVTETDRDRLREQLRRVTGPNVGDHSTTSVELSLIGKDGEHLIAKATSRGMSFEGETCVELSFRTRQNLSRGTTLAQAPWRAYLSIAFLVIFTLLPLALLPGLTINNNPKV